MDASNSQDKLIADLIFHAGYGTNKALSDLSADQTWIIESALEDGWLRFATPPVLPGQSKAHEWSFLRPMHIMTVLGSVDDHDLPDDFGGMDGPIEFHNDTSVSTQIELVNEMQIARLRNGTPSSGRPMYCAVRPKKERTGNVTGYELLMYPKPDKNYDITWKGRSVSDISDAFESLFLGGTPHFLTVKAACFSELEARLDGLEAQVHEQKFYQRLAASIQYDRQSFSSQTVGPNLDQSDARNFPHSRSDYGKYTTSYVGDVSNHPNY